MRIPMTMLASAAMLLIAGCNDNSDPEAASDASSLPEMQNAPVDSDPTPQTGTGGEQQVADPEGTVK